MSPNESQLSESEEESIFIQATIKDITYHKVFEEDYEEKIYNQLDQEFLTLKLIDSNGKKLTHEVMLTIPKTTELKDKPRIKDWWRKKYLTRLEESYDNEIERFPYAKDARMVDREKEIQSLKGRKVTLTDNPEYEDVSLSANVKQTKNNVLEVISLIVDPIYVFAGFLAILYTYFVAPYLISGVGLLLVGMFIRFIYYEKIVR